MCVCKSLRLFWNNENLLVYIFACKILFRNGQVSVDFIWLYKHFRFFFPDLTIQGRQSVYSGPLRRSITNIITILWVWIQCFFFCMRFMIQKLLILNNNTFLISCLVWRMCLWITLNLHHFLAKYLPYDQKKNIYAVTDDLPSLKTMYKLFPGRQLFSKLFSTSYKIYLNSPLIT